MRWLLIAGLLTACAGQPNTDWDAIEAEITEASSSSFVKYFAEDNELVVEVDPGTTVLEGKHIACDVVVPAIEDGGRDPSRVTISVFQRGSDDVLFDANGC